MKIQSHYKPSGEKIYTTTVIVRGCYFLISDQNRENLKKRAIEIEREEREMLKDDWRRNDLID